MRADTMYAGVKAGGQSGAELAYFAPAGTPLPATPFADLDPAFVSAGLCTQDGYSQTQDLSKESVYSFGILTPTRVLKTQQETSGSLTFQQTSPTALEVYNQLPLGSIVPTATGEMTVTQGPIRSQRYVCVIETFDGPNRTRLVMPEIEPDKDGDFGISMGSVTERAIAMTAYPDADGNAVYEHYLIPALGSTVPVTP